MFITKTTKLSNAQSKVRSPTERCNGGTTRHLRDLLQSFGLRFAHTKRSGITEVNPAVQSPALNVSKCSGAEQHKSKQKAKRTSKCMDKACHHYCCFSCLGWRTQISSSMGIWGRNEAIPKLSFTPGDAVSDMCGFHIGQSATKIHPHEKT